MVATIPTRTPQHPGRALVVRALAPSLGVLLGAAACTGPGAVALPEPTDGAADAAPDSSAEGGATCALDAAYTFGNDGGNVAYRDESTLTPPASYAHVRIPVRQADAAAPSCAPALPPCSDAARLDVADILSDLADPDVRAALAASSPPIYGLDERPTDGAIFSVQRADGRGFFAGPDCDAGSFCYGAVPAGVARLVADLEALDLQQIADPACAAFRQGP